jgi:hypothetical protein
VLRDSIECAGAFAYGSRSRAMTHFAPAILSYLGTVDSLETLVRLDHDCKQNGSSTLMTAYYEIRGW